MPFECLGKNKKRVYSNRIALAKTSQVPVQRVVWSRSLSFNKLEAAAVTAGESRWAPSTLTSHFILRASPMAATIKKKKKSKSLEIACRSQLQIILTVPEFVTAESPHSCSVSKTTNEDLIFQTAKTALSVSEVSR